MKASNGASKLSKRGSSGKAAGKGQRGVSVLILLIAVAVVWLVTLRGRVQSLSSRGARVLASVENEIKDVVHELKDEFHAFEQNHGLLRPHPLLLESLKVPDATCKSHFGVEYHGRRLDEQPGNKHSAEACCEACQQTEECDTWSWCGSPDKCLDLLHNCVLRQGDNPSLPTVSKAAPTVGWSSGFVIRDHLVEEMFSRRGMELVHANKMVLGLRKGQATISHLGPKGEPSFSFAAPHDLRAMNRTAGGFHHLGDITLRVQYVPQDTAAAAQRNGPYTKLSTVAPPSGPDTPLQPHALPIDTPPASSLSKPVKVYGHVDLKPQLPPDAPVRITRWIEVPQVSGLKGLIGKKPHGITPEEIRVYWNITYQPAPANQGSDLELGSVALSMPFDQIFSDRTLETVAVQCSFVEAYPGGALGHIEVVRATGSGPSLLVLPAPDTVTSFEAWRHLETSEDGSMIGFGFEGHYEVMAFSKAWAKNEWRDAKQWVPPTSHTLSPGQSVLLGVRMVMAAGPQQVEDALLAMGHPVVVGAPGFIVHADMTDARLFVKHIPMHLSIETVTVEPAGAVEISPVSVWGLAGPRPPPPGVHVHAYKLSFPRKASAGSNIDDDPAAWSTCPAYDAINTPGADTASLTVNCPAYIGRVTLKFRFRRGGPPQHASGHLAHQDMQRPGDEAPSGDVLEQFVQLMVLPPAVALVKQYGRTSADPAHGWLPESVNDPWGRSPAFMGYDNEAKTALTYELRVYMAGLSDESGAAQPLAMAMKQLGSPSADQIQKLEEYIHKTLYTPVGGDRRKFIQDHDTYAVRASLLYNGTDPAFKKAQPDFIDKCFKTGPYWQICWDEKRSLEAWRSYNYVHVAAVYWSMYRLSRVGTPAYTTKNTWEWYLRQAARTMQAMWQHGKGYGRWGLMVGSVFTHIAKDVELEGWTTEHQALQAMMKERLEFWQGLTFPFGSEMSWDNTGHEEIASWLAVANDTAGEAATVQAVQAYTRLVPHWAISGSARRWWDFFINGKANIGNERVYHHYAGALNAVPVMQFYKKHPENLQLIRLATAGVMGSLTNIKPDGGASMGWHGNPRRLNMDGYSADYGIGFYGYTMQAGGVLACDEALGWLCFNCDIIRLQQPSSQAHRGSGSACRQQVEASLALRDAFRRRLFLAPIAVDIEVEKAWIVQAQVDFAARTIQLTLAAHDLRDGSASKLTVPAVIDALVTVKKTAIQGTVARLGQLSMKCNGSPCDAGAARRGPDSVLVKVKQQQAADPQVIIQWQEVEQ